MYFKLKVPLVGCKSINKLLLQTLICMLTFYSHKYHVYLTDDTFEWCIIIFFCLVFVKWIQINFPYISKWYIRQVKNI